MHVVRTTCTCSSSPDYPVVTIPEEYPRFSHVVSKVEVGSPGANLKSVCVLKNRNVPGGAVAVQYPQYLTVAMIPCFVRFFSLLVTMLW